jgi:hypothetical protein
MDSIIFIIIIIIIIIIMCEANHSLPPRTHAKNKWSYTIIPSMPSQHADGLLYLYFLLAQLLQ